MNKKSDGAAHGCDKEDFVRLVREHKGTIYTVCYMFSKNTDEVNDLYQEILVNLWRGFGKFEGKSDIRTWFYRVALNTCISADRKKKTRRGSNAPGVNLFEGNEHGDGQIEMLHKRITRLQPFDRAIVLLWLEDMSYEEIGAVVGITAKNVSVRLFRIREKLKSMSDN